MSGGINQEEVASRLLTRFRGGQCSKKPEKQRRDESAMVPLRGEKTTNGRGTKKGREGGL